MHLKNNYKNFCTVIIIFLIVFILVNYFIWTRYTSLYYQYSNNDLARIGYIPLQVSSNMQIETDRKAFRELSDAIKDEDYSADIITIGDSFSNGGGGIYYQNLIANKGLKVLNIPSLPLKDEISTISILLNSGYLDKIKPKVIIIESVERACANKYSKEIDFNSKLFTDEINDIYTSQKQPSNPDVSFINSGNFKFLVYNLLYMFSDHAYISQVYKTKLDSNLFSAGKDSNTLLFFHEDLKTIKNSTPENIAKLNNNMNELAKRLAGKNIKLWFMPAVDKYDLYYDNIKIKKYPQNPFFEQLRHEDKKDYYFIDTKKILSKLITNGVKDVYHVGDTHWNIIAAQAIVDSLPYQGYIQAVER